MGAVAPRSFSPENSLPSVEVARLVLWDTETAMPVQVYAGHLNRKLLLEACFVLGVSAPGGGSSPASETALEPVRAQGGVTSTPDAALVALYTRESFSVACGSEDGQLFLWDGGSGQLAARIPGHLGACNSVCPLPCAGLASSRPAGARGLPSPRLLAGEVDVEHKAETARRLMGVQSTLVSSGDDGVVRLWSLCS
jgi:WD40 repeat protein